MKFHTWKTLKRVFYGWKNKDGAWILGPFVEDRK